MNIQNNIKNLTNEQKEIILHIICFVTVILLVLIIGHIMVEDYRNDFNTRYLQSVYSTTAAQVINN